MRKIALSLILWALAMPAAMAQQSWGWVKNIDYHETWQLWKPLRRIDNYSDKEVMRVKTPRPAVPMPGSSRITGSKFEGCPWSKLFSQHMDEPYAIALPTLKLVTQVDDEGNEIGPAPDEIEIPARSRLIVEYRYYQSRGWEYWYWLEPPKGVEVPGVRPSAENMGPHRREVNRKERWQMRYKITPL